MRRLLIATALIIMLAQSASAFDVRLAWDHDATDVVFDLERSLDQGATWSVIISNIPEKRIVYNSNEFRIHTYRVYAKRGGVVSEPSNVLVIDYSRVAPPTNLRKE